MKVFRIAGCIITNPQGQLLLLHRNTHNYDHWELPGGKVEPGETDKQAAEREIAEELGIKVGAMEYAGERTFSDRGYDFLFVWFHARSFTGSPKVMEPEIFDRLQYFSIDELTHLNLSINMQNLLDSIKSGQVKLL